MMFIPHFGQPGNVAATPAASDTWINDLNLEIPSRSVWHVEVMSNVRDVENLLDELENQCGVNNQELTVQGNANFIVSWESDSPNREPRFSPDRAVS